MSRSTTKALIVALALGATALAGEPAAATPMAGAAAIEQAAPAAAAGTEKVFFHRHRGFYRRGFYGYRRFGYRRGFRFHRLRRF